MKLRDSTMLLLASISMLAAAADVKHMDAEWHNRYLNRAAMYHSIWLDHTWPQ